MAGMRVAKFERGRDWPQSLHLACNKLECAAQNAIDAVTVRQAAAALTALKAARETFGRQMLKLEKARRQKPVGRQGWHYDSQGYCDNPGRGY